MNFNLQNEMGFHCQIIYYPWVLLNNGQIERHAFLNAWFLMKMARNVLGTYSITALPVFVKTCWHRWESNPGLLHAN